MCVAEEDSDDEPPPPPPPATSSTTAVTVAHPKITVIASNYTAHIPAGAGQIQLIPGPQILTAGQLNAVSKAPVLFTGLPGLGQSQGTSASQMLTVTSVAGQVVSEQAQLVNCAKNSATLDNLGVGSNVVNHQQQGGSVYAGMFSMQQQPSGTAGGFTAPQQQNHFPISQLTSVPPSLPLEHSHQPSQQPAIPQITPTARPLPHPPAPSLPLGPQPLAPDILPAPSTSLPAAALLQQPVTTTTSSVNTTQILLPSEGLTSVAATESLSLPPPPPPPQILRRASAHQMASASSTTVNGTTVAAILPPPTLPLLTQPQQPAENGAVPSLLSISTKPTKTFTSEFFLKILVSYASLYSQTD